MQTELARDSSLSAVSDFDRANLKPTETKEKVILPGEEDIKTEKTHQGILLVSNKRKIGSDFILIKEIFRE